MSRDGTQFLVLRPVSGSVSVIFVNNWTNELRARMAVSAAKQGTPVEVAERVGSG